MTEPLPHSIGTDHIAERLIVVRGQRVILDSDLAALYGVTTKRFNEQVRRNAGRFPGDFMFRLSNQEVANLRSQFATSSWGGRRYMPHVFTEHGALMAATVLNSPRAIEISVYVMRAFLKLREMLSAHKELSGKLAELERKFANHDRAIAEIIGTIRHLMDPPEVRKQPIGFVRPKEK
jgi:hypothetical protein